MIYTPVEKNFGYQPPDVLLGAWHWKVEEGKIVDFNANISKISTIGEASQSVRIINFKTPSYLSNSKMAFQSMGRLRLN